MIIENAQYCKNYNNVNTCVKATIDGSELFVPLDTANTHYAEILKQVADSNITIAEAD